MTGFRYNTEDTGFIPFDFLTSYETREGEKMPHTTQLLFDFL